MPTNNLLALKQTTLGLSVFWTLLIVTLCLVSFNDLPDVKVSGFDKLVHVGFHFVFVSLWGIYFSLKKKGIHLAKIIQLVAISLTYGIIIEILQETLTKTRHADPLDAAANLSGALLSLLTFAIIKRRKARNSPL